MPEDNTVKFEIVLIT